MKTSILNTTAVQAYAKAQKLQPYRVKQLFQEIFDNQQIDFDEMTTLSKDLRTQFKENFEILSLNPETIIEDEQTTKIWFTTHDNFTIEAVLMFHWSKHHDDKLNRITLCLSTQVGCPIWCAFCVTGKLGFKRNLTREEMISQVLYANNYIKKKFGKKEDKTERWVRNIVFMGMGEPLLNYDNLKKTIEVLLRQEGGFSLSRRHITISTAGIIPGIQQLITDDIPVKLAISLHAPSQELRDKLMPVAKAYPLDQLMKTIDDYVRSSDNRIFYEYIMIRGITDKPELATQLIKLLKGRLAHVNLIPYNTNPAIDMKESDEKTMRTFKDILERWGITVTIRDSMGRELKGACGQLWYEKIAKQ